MIEVGVVAEDRQAQVKNEGGDPEIVGGDGSAAEFQVETEVGIDAGEVRGRCEMDDLFALGNAAERVRYFPASSIEPSYKSRWAARRSLADEDLHVSIVS